jgi:hypothetical protein
MSTETYSNLSEDKFVEEVEKCLAIPNVSTFLQLFAGASLKWNPNQDKNGLFFSSNTTIQKLVAEMNRQLNDEADFGDFLQALENIDETIQLRIISVSDKFNNLWNRNWFPEPKQCISRPSPKLWSLCMGKIPKVKPKN